MVPTFAKPVGQSAAGPVAGGPAGGGDAGGGVTAETGGNAPMPGEATSSAPPLQALRTTAAPQVMRSLFRSVRTRISHLQLCHSRRRAFVRHSCDTEVTRD